MQPSLQDRKRTLVKDAIWEAATDLFAVRGYDDTTIEEIVQVAGISQRSFFRYFTSKSDLMSHSMESYGDALAASIEGCPPNATDVEILKTTLREVTAHVLGQERTLKTMKIIAQCPAARSAEISRYPQVHQRVVQALTARDAAGGNPFGILLLAGLTLQSAGATIRTCLAHPGDSIDARVEEAVKTLQSILCPGAQA
jgi:AcrR family transcriptional regulator